MTAVTHVAAGGGDGHELTKADFQSDQETRWCPGCGDYAILASVQALMPELGVPPEKTVFISGIGCAGRFAYYMDTYGMHGIHGRAPALATGIATAHLRHLEPMPANTGEVARSFGKVLVPELNTGQLLSLLRSRYLVDAVGHNKVEGQPILAEELEKAILEALS